MNDILNTLRKVQTQLSVLHGEVTDLISHFDAAKTVATIDDSGGPGGSGPGEGPDGHP